MILGIASRLDTKPAGPGPQHVAGEGLFIVRRIDQDLHRRPARLDVVDQLDAVLAVQGKIDDDHVRMLALDQPQRILDMLGSPQTSRSGSRPIAMASPWRTTGWSSTIRTRRWVKGPEEVLTINR